jgi:hypothetical protein
MLRRLIFILALFAGTTNVYAANDGDEAPQSDVGMETESVPEDGVPKIPKINFTVIDDAPVIDGELTDLFWKQALEFSLDFVPIPSDGRGAKSMAVQEKSHPWQTCHASRRRQGCLDEVDNYGGISRRAKEVSQGRKE